MSKQKVGKYEKLHQNRYKIPKENILFSREKEELFVISYHVSSSYILPPTFAKRQAKNLMINGLSKQVAKKRINRQYPNLYRYKSSI